MSCGILAKWIQAENRWVGFRAIANFLFFLYLYYWSADNPVSTVFLVHYDLSDRETILKCFLPRLCWAVMTCALFLETCLALFHNFNTNKSGNPMSGWRYRIRYSSVDTCLDTGIIVRPILPWITWHCTKWHAVKFNSVSCCIFLWLIAALSQKGNTVNLHFITLARQCAYLHHS